MGLAVNKVVLEESLFEMALERGRETPTEVAFFMVGLVRNGVAYVYDLVEFDYEERSIASVKSGLERKLRLAGVLPLGLELLGNMHKHPGSPRPSRIDWQMFLSYARGGGPCAFIIYTVSPVEIRAYTVLGQRVFEVECEVRELTEDERLISFDIEVPINIRVCVQKSISPAELRALLSSRICRELEKQAYFPRLFSGSSELLGDRLPERLDVLLARPLKPVDVEVGWMEGLSYRLYVDEEAADEEVVEEVLRVLGRGLQVELGGGAPGRGMRIKVLRAPARASGGLG